MSQPTHDDPPTAGSPTPDPDPSPSGASPPDPPPSGSIQADPPIQGPRSPTPYDMVGGEAGVRRLVDGFYEFMDSEPEAAGIRALHARSLKSSREKLFLFLSGWLGGPSLYVERYGPPMLRARHLPFPIASRERDEWIWCMDRALAEQEMPEMVREYLKERFRTVADHMKNREDGGDSLGRGGGG